jgi:hypothetical protein
MPYYGHSGYVEMIWFSREKHLSFAGYFPLYALASYVVYATPNGVSTAIRGGVYAVGAGGQGGLHPAWVAA